MALLFVSWNLTAYEDTCFGVYCSHVYSVFYDCIWLAMLSHLCFLFHSMHNGREVVVDFFSNFAKIIAQMAQQGRTNMQS